MEAHLDRTEAFRRIAHVFLFACCLLLADSITACANKDSGSSVINMNVSEKSQVPCPEQTARTEVLFAFGQSNSANQASHLYSNIDSRILNYYDGHCYIAADPMLNATGTNGSVWIPLANKLLSTGNFDHIILATAGYSGSLVARWTKSGDLYQHYSASLADVSNRYTVTKFLWDQGEADALAQTSNSAYKDSLLEVISTALQTSSTASFYVSIASRCGNVGPDSNVTDAQHSVVDHVRVFEGPDSDSEIPVSMRRPEDKCHFANSGQEKMAQLWYQTIL